MSFFGDLVSKVQNAATSAADSVAEATGIKKAAVGPNVSDSLKTAGLPTVASESAGTTMTGGRRRRRRTGKKNKNRRKTRR